MTWIGLLLCALSLGIPDYWVVLDKSRAEEFRGAATALADFHSAQIVTQDMEDLDGLEIRLREGAPQWVSFVLPPERIDVDLTHRLMEICSRIDNDPFADFEYAFVTGRDGLHAESFVHEILNAWDTELGNKAGLFGSWEGNTLPPPTGTSAAKALGLDLEIDYVSIHDNEESRMKKSRAILEQMSKRDFLLLFSHGYPDQMVGCFTAQDLRNWKIDFSGSVIINCACYNGVTGKWFDISPERRFTDRGHIALEDSIALQVLDSGAAAYVGGINPWHGWLSNQASYYLLDDGMRLGEASKAMADRLAIAFYPDPISYPPTNGVTFDGEGVSNRRRNGAGMIVFGDPKWAPYSHGAKTLTKSRCDRRDGKLMVQMASAPLVKGEPGDDFLLPQSRMTNYYSVKTSDVLNELRAEIYRSMPLPDEVKEIGEFKVTLAQCGGEALDIHEVITLIEMTKEGNRLHVSVTFEPPIFRSSLRLNYARKGVVVTLEEI